MSTENSNVFKKDNLDLYLKELAKEYKKLVGGKMPAEIVLIGGAAVIESYGFRDMTADVDAIISSASAMKDAINLIGERYDLPSGWLNADFRKTDSYSGKLLQYSSFYRTFCQVLNVRIVTGEYLIAMKLRAFRQYKNDISDVIGILAEHEKRGDGITAKRIDRAAEDLYGSWDGFPDGARDFIMKTLSAGNYESVYDLVRKNEKEAREQLVEFRESYPDALKGENVDDVLQKLRAKKQISDHE
ncbi:MAG: hypothetical protein IJM71_06495 [Clostridia bacterium]|nr:hypothetical protein [Clostridia bacterium]MBQ7475038.1 hypothetical protein [Clostridia bacterium]